MCVQIELAMCKFISDSVLCSNPICCLIMEKIIHASYNLMIFLDATSSHRVLTVLFCAAILSVGVSDLLLSTTSGRDHRFSTQNILSVWDFLVMPTFGVCWCWSLMSRYHRLQKLADHRWGMKACLKCYDRRTLASQTYKRFETIDI